MVHYLAKEYDDCGELVICLEHDNAACGNITSYLEDEEYIGLWTGTKKYWPRSKNSLVFCTYGSFVQLCVKYKDLLRQVSLLVFDEPHVRDADMNWLLSVVLDFLNEDSDADLRLLFSGGTLNCEFMHRLPIPVGQILL